MKNDRLIEFYCLLISKSNKKKYGRISQICQI